MRRNPHRFLAAVLFLTGVQAGFAAVLQVDQSDPGCDDISGSPAYCTLGAAVADAAEGDTVSVGAGTYSGPPNRSIESDKSLSIIGAGSGQTTIDLESSGDFAIFGEVPYAGSYMEVILSDMTIMNGGGSGAALRIAPHTADVVIRRVHFIDNQGLGAEIGVNSDSVDSSLLVVDCLFESNTGGGLALYGPWDYTRAVVTGSTFVDNTGSGGASVIGTVRDSEFINNQDTGDSSPSRGGGLAILGIVENSTFVGNSADEGGGVGYLPAPYPEEYLYLIVRNSTFAENTAERGGALGGGIPQQTSVIITPPPMPLILNAISIENSSFIGNAATSEGGGIFVSGDSPVTERVDLEFVNSTLSGNAAPDGAAISLGGIVDGRVRFNTFVDNDAATGASLFWDNMVAEYGHNVVSGTGTLCATGPGFSGLSLGYNLASSASCDILFDAGTDISGTDPSLDVLADNGGPTQTHLPLGGSPLIDSGGGECPETDQRGYGRPAGSACDRGAVEAGAVPLGLDADPIPVFGRSGVILLCLLVLLSSLISEYR